MSKRVPVDPSDPRELDGYGWEVPDQNRVEIPAGFKRPETLAEQVQRLVRTSISRQAEAEGYETWEEANDFDVDDDFDPTTPYEEFFDPVIGRSVTPEEFRQHEARYREEVLTRTKNYYRLREQEALEEEVAKPVRKRGAGVPPAPSSESSQPGKAKESPDAK